MHCRAGQAAATTDDVLSPILHLKILNQFLRGLGVCRLKLVLLKLILTHSYLLTIEKKTISAGSVKAAISRPGLRGPEER
jgi:hypothetical protein